jgi:hypothetical protein
VDARAQPVTKILCGLHKEGARPIGAGHSATMSLSGPGDAPLALSPPETPLAKTGAKTAARSPSPSTPASVAEARRLWEDLSNADTLSVASNDCSPTAKGGGLWDRLKTAATQNKYVSSAVSSAVSALTESERLRAAAAEAERDSALQERDQALVLAAVMRGQRDEARVVAGGALLAMLAVGPLDQWRHWAHWAGTTGCVVVALRVARRLQERRSGRDEGMAGTEAEGAPEKQLATAVEGTAVEGTAVEGTAVERQPNSSCRQTGSFASMWRRVSRPSVGAAPKDGNARPFLHSYLATCMVTGAAVILADRLMPSGALRLSDGGASA